MKIKMVNLGCPKNLVDSEVMAGILENAGGKIVEELSEADFVIINTCGFIEPAKEESINTILEVAEYKDEYNFKIIVAGCLVQRYIDDLKKELPEVDTFIGVHEYPDILEILHNNFTGDIDREHKRDNLLKNYNRKNLSYEHVGYVKISDGCDNFCSYCSIPFIRGPKKSKPKDLVLEEVRKYALDPKIKEIILVAQDTTSYGIDLYGKKVFTELLREISDIVPAEKWIRVMYVHPDNLTEELLELIYSRKNIVNYLDLPIQHISDKILDLMNRRYKRENIIFWLEKIREKYPEVSLRTSLIVGFPGEHKKDYEELKDFIQKYHFDRLGVFSYSREEGTKAYDFKGSVSEKTKESRLSELMMIQQDIAEKLNMNYVGKKIKVLIDRELNDEYFDYEGRTEYDAPDIDQSVLIQTEGKKLEIGGFYEVEIIESWEFDLVAKL